MKKIAIVFRRSPFGNTSSREGLDLSLLSASFEQQVTVIFVAEGLLNLLSDQQPELSGSKDYIATFKAMPIYDIETILVCETSLTQLNLTSEALQVAHQVASNKQISQALTEADEVLVF
ncbi:sulfurtransferase complex subunit TusC [Shewanella sp. WXL01]|uniref:sulfurtransferase complex subunit TusC n=1 Tax=Shewanella sp. WXL01 TaxID=2709721 RepID=UPI0014384156|nr:sulfurtransferase complex subunit TusC [Shewanella sp. WXL01]NKF50598.1 sulfurtransferase complex subunit TusC [Shewanella sp. WXL01]